MKSIPVKVSGNIINEFSEKVPSYMFAINEVLKNSYDACATLINITYDLNEHTLEVSDNGFGISEESLESLFHIAESSKNYGEKICGDRYQQGEKGLGLLAVFKFGNLVEWETMHKSFSNSIKFEVDKREIIKLSNITDFDLPIEDLNKKGSVGTIVKIVCDEVENQDIIGEFFSSDINTKKITNLFLDSGIKVSFKLIGDSKNSNKDKSISLEKAMNENKKLCIFEVEIDSEKNSSVIFKNKSTIVRKICFDKKELPHSISVKANLKILSLKGSSVKSVNTLFHLTRSQRSSLRPLVYINKVLFNNYELFDPEISRGTQSSKSLPQIIGYLDILTTNSRVSFNADRTQLIENSTVREIEAYLLGLNLFIQEEASKLRREMRKNPSVSLEDLYSDDSSAESSSSESSNSDDSNSDDSNSDDSNSDDSNSDDSNSDDSNSDDSNSDDSNSDDSNSDDSNSDDSNSDDSNSDDSNSDDSSSDNTNLEHEPIIKLSKRSYTETFDFSSKTIDLYTFIDEIRNRKGEKILQKEVDIYLNGIKKDDHYLSNVQNSQEYSLTFKFLDDLSIITSNPIKLKYIKNRHELQSSESKNSLINSVSFSYEVTIPVAGELIYQINKLWAIDDDYRIVITPSLRTIFEICCQKINNFENIFDISEDNPKYIKSLEKKVEKCVEHILDYSKIRANTQFYRKITNEYDNFKNIYIPKDFEEAVKKSNLGSHYATTNLDNDKIQSIALHAGYFAQLIDAYLKDRGYT